jgi:hypothetical protein
MRVQEQLQQHPTIDAVSRSSKTTSIEVAAHLAAA